MTQFISRENQIEHSISKIESQEDLEELLTQSSDQLQRYILKVQSPLLVLGGAGKMGPSLAVLARRAADAAGQALRVVVISRFSNPEAKSYLEAHGIETIACDLLNREQVMSLPESENVINMVGLKFGTQTNPSLTWAVNTLAPANVAEKYQKAKITVLSTGNVYPLSLAAGEGALETDRLTPIGEYGNAAIARERIFEHFSITRGVRVVILRLNYAVDLRYGVLLEIAQKVWAGAPVDVTTGYVNCIWQGDANDIIIRSLDLAQSPPAVFNLTGPKISVHALALRLGELMDREVAFCGAEAETALLSNPVRLHEMLGKPPTSLDSMLRWTAEWVMKGGLTLGKPTRFEVRDGQY